jgi:hypothetical protein
MEANKLPHNSASKRAGTEIKKCQEIKERQTTSKESLQPDSPCVPLIYFVAMGGTRRYESGWL